MASSNVKTREWDNLSITHELIRRLHLQAALSRLQFVHIAGTKGKGSTAFATAKLLQQAGLRVGLFTSPHLVDVRERCLINGEMVDEAHFSKALSQFQLEHDRVFDAEAWPQDSRGGNLPHRINFFRVLFLFALRLFDTAAVDVVVLEVGVGGRLDSTNAVTPVACGITALGMDHMDLLGDTIELIAYEKAGIAKPNVPCFTTCQRDYPQTIEVIAKQAQLVGAPLTVVGDDWFESADWTTVSQRGDHMVENSRLALALARTVLGRDVRARVTPDELATLEASAYPGRSQVMPNAIKGATLYLDGAHTPESMRVAAKWFFEAAQRDGYLHASTGDGAPGSEAKAVLLFFSSRDNRKLLQAFVPYAALISKIVFVSFPHDSPQLPNTDIEPLNRAREAWQGLASEHEPRLSTIQAVVFEEPLCAVDDLTAAVGTASSEGSGKTNGADVTTATVPVLCTGSLYLVGAVLQIIARAPRKSTTTTS